MKIAIIGSGAAGAGAVLGLATHGAALSIDMIDQARPASDGMARQDHPREWKDGYLAAIYRRVLKENGRSLPLPKSHFGLTVPRIVVDGRPRLWNSGFRGGLTNFWGGTMMPLLESDFRDWPIERSDLRPYYDRLTAAVGVSGASDGLSRVLGGEHSNRPALRIHPMIKRIIAAIEDKASETDPATLHAGINRIALETRPERADSCVYCGECLIGCFRGAIFTTARWVEGWARNGTITNLSDARVTRINLKDRSLTVMSSSGVEETTGSYDRIYIAAGCFGSTRLLMDSLGIDLAVMKDSKVVNTPIAFTGGHAEVEPTGESFGLTHGLVLIPDERGDRIAAQVQLYPTLPHFWRSVLPPSLWHAAGTLAAPLRSRLFWARTFLANKAANRYRLFRESTGEISLSLVEAEGSEVLVDYAHKRLARVLRGSGFSLLHGLSSSGGTSSHYAASEPFQVDAGLVDKEWRVAEGVYLVDSAAWPDVPAMSPTMTIMANAMRIAEQSVG